MEGAQGQLGDGGEYQLSPPQEEDVFALDYQQLREKYGRRVDIFVDLLRAQKKAAGSEERLTQIDLNNMRVWIQALNSLDEYIRNHQDPEHEEETLRPAQFDAFQDIRDFLERGETDGYVKLPTGFGKTVLFTKLIEALNMRTLVVVPTKVLVEQTEGKIDQFAEDLDYGSVYQKAKEFGRQVTITTYASLLQQMKAGTIKPEDFDCLILDEAHMALSDARKKAVRAFEGKIKLGFTATPRYQRRSVEDLLPTEIHRMDVREAVEGGLLSSFSAIVAKTETDISNVHVNAAGEYDEKELARAVDIQSRNQSALELYQGNFKGESAIAYCVGVKHAERVAKMFTEAEITATAVSGHTSDAERERIFADFKEGKVQVLTNADLLITGYDEPRASVCLNLRPTNSPIVAEQRAGRVLRLDDDRPEKHAHVVDFVDRNSSRRQILFADIAGGAYIFPRGEKRKGGSHVPPPPMRHIDIEGLMVVVDPEEVLRIVSEIKTAGEATQDAVLTAIREQGITTADWVGLPQIDANKLKITVGTRELGLTALASLFSIPGRAETRPVFLNLCRAIFGKEEVDAALEAQSDKSAKQKAVLTAIREKGITAADWVGLPQTESNKLKIIVGTNELGVVALTNLFSIPGNAGSRPVFLNLCRAIFGKEEVDAALEAQSDKSAKQKAVRTAIREQGITAAYWIGLSKREVIKLKITIGRRKLGLLALTTLFGIPGNAQTKPVFHNLCRAIFGDAEVDAALAERGN